MFYNLRYSNHVLNSTKVKVQIAYSILFESGPTDYCEALDRLQR